MAGPLPGSHRVGLLRNTSFPAVRLIGVVASSTIGLPIAEPEKDDAKE